MTSRLGRTDSDSDTGVRSARVGLSDYTAQKLAELRARRAELDSDYTEYKSSLKPRTESVSTSSLTSATTTPSSSDLLESYRSRRGLSSTSALSTTPSPTVKPATTVNGTVGNSTTTNGISTTSAKPAPPSTKPTLSAKPTTVSTTHDGTSSSSTSLRSSTVPSQASKSLSNGHVATASALATSKTAATTLNSTASFSKADYTSSRGGAVDHVKVASSLSRSCSARLPTSGLPEDDDECVGFASLPEQVHRKAVKRGFDFTLMVVGETGLGKSTLISSLFLNPELYKDREIPSVQDRISKTVRLEKSYMEIEEKGVKLRLSIVDTPGFNDSMDAEQSWRPIEDYINTQFDQYFKDETGLNRKNIKDHRVHCCLYFVSPYGHGLRQIDVEFMKRLHDKVNIVPIIAKSDTLTRPEVRKLKEKILEQVETHRIQIYEFPDCDSDEDEDFKTQDSELKAAIPFAVIGSNTVVDVNGKKIRGRLYPWGIVEVDNPEHCDFSKLRMMLISTHMQDLKDVTRDIHYENFRARHIKEQMKKNQRERNKLKRDSSPNFENIINQDDLLEKKDEEIRQMQAMILKMQAELKSKGGVSNGSAPVVGLGNL